MLCFCVVHYVDFVHWCVDRQHAGLECVLYVVVVVFDPVCVLQDLRWGCAQIESPTRMHRLSQVHMLLSSDLVARWRGEVL
jgi:hypothetical protein